jgi:hypothetical protein
VREPSDGTESVALPVTLPYIGAVRPAIAVLLVAAAVACQTASTDSTRPERIALDAARFARLVTDLSEDGGYFDTDNIISNEQSYLHVLGTLEARGVSGGAYVGVGPDQNYAYIARVRPSIAFILDIRRDNLLEHLMFKAVFALARNRVEYLCLLVGRPLPAASERWSDRTIEEIVAYVDRAPTLPAADQSVATARIVEQARRTGLELTAGDIATVEALHRQFVRGGLDLKFQSHNRLPAFYYPTYRQLLLETDLSGRKAGYLAAEDDFQFLRRLHATNRIVPLVGDFAGERALAGVGTYLAANDERLSVFYTSNVEFYLMRQRRFDRFVANLARLPRNARSVIVRSYFHRYRVPHPQSRAGYASTQLLQTIDSLVEEHQRYGYENYWDLITKHSLTLR